MIRRKLCLLVLAPMGLVVNAAAAEDQSETRVETTVRSSSGSEAPVERSFKKVTKNGVTVEESGDPSLSTNGFGFSTDPAELERSIEARVRQMLEELRQKTEGGAGLENSKRGTGPGKSSKSADKSSDSASASERESSQSSASASSSESSSSRSESSSSDSRSSSSSDRDSGRKSGRDAGSRGTPKPDGSVRPGGRRAEPDSPNSRTSPPRKPAPKAPGSASPPRRGG